MDDTPPAENLSYWDDDIRAAARLLDLTFTAQELALMRENVRDNRDHYRLLRAQPLGNDVAPALRFDPRPAGFTLPPQPPAAPDPPTPIVTRPANLDALAFASLSELGALLRSGQVSALELTDMYLDRLERHGETLACVITLTPERARAQARRADKELAVGIDRGPLHGIPWGAKDLLAVRGYPTTWGAAPFKTQEIDLDAAVVERLDDAGAVLVAKLALGALAYDDVWFGGRTRNPWNLEEGSSGSSAGSAAAVAAGLVSFAIGSETLGSIISPATRCGVSGLRPTFGRISRHGAMALSWTMDKLGPIARSAEDCALVFDALHGGDGRDLSVVDAPYSWPVSVDLAGLRIGYLAEDFAAEGVAAHETAALETLRTLGAELLPIRLPDLPYRAIGLTLWVEAAAAFDALTRSNRDDALVRQTKESWPNIFRYARLVPAVELLQANRVRTQLLAGMATLFTDVDVYVAPSFSDSLYATNLSGHPAVVVPAGLDETGSPANQSITFTGRLYDEATLLAVARTFQEATPFHQPHPPDFS